MNIGMVFPGYGSQFVGMGKELYDQSRVMQEFFEEAANCLDQNFVKLCFASSEIELSKMEHAYPAIFLMSCSLYSILQSLDIIPNIVSGYNHGEYAAFFASKSINFPDGLYLLSKYALLFQESGIYHEQDLVQLQDVTNDRMRTITKEFSLDIIAYDSPNSFVIAGATEHVRAVERWWKEAGGKVVRVGSAFGFHTTVMNPVVQQLKMYLEKVDFKDPEIDIVSTTTGKFLKSSSDIKSHILDQILYPVQWIKVMEQFQNCDCIIQIGPGTMLSSWLQSRYPDKTIFTFNTLQDLDVIQKYMRNNQ